MSKKQVKQEGQIYAIPLPDDSFTIGQLVNHHKVTERDSQDTFAFFNYRFSSLEEAKEKSNKLDFSNPFSIATINGYLRQYGWTLLGIKDICFDFNYKEKIDNIGLYNMRSTDPAIFLEPYFGLYPWDAYPAGYIDKHILPNADMGKNIKYCKDYNLEELIEILGENHIKVKERLKQEK